MKRRAATLSLSYNVVLTALKLVAALYTGSVSMLSEAAHGATDIVASGFGWISVRAAAAPPDEEHPYGHGKIEALAGFGESVLLLFIVGYIVFEASRRLAFGAEPAQLDLALAVMALSVVTSFFVGRHVTEVGKKTQSLVLMSNGQHLMVDFWTSVGVLLALGITKLTGWVWADAVAALLLACWLAWGAWKMTRRAFHELIDRRLPDDEIRIIEKIIGEEKDVLGCHRLRTRHSGQTHYIEMHIVLPNDWSLVRAHDLADSLEKRIADALPPAHVVIHVDPFDEAKVLAGHGSAE